MSAPTPTRYTTSTGDEFWFGRGPNFGYYPPGYKPERIELAPPTLYKAVTQTGQSPIASGREQWSLPTQNADGTWTPGGWMEPNGGAKGELLFCHRGLHAFDGKHWSEWVQYGRIFVIEFDGAVAYDQGKWLGARARLVRELDVTPLTSLAREETHGIARWKLRGYGNKASYIESQQSEHRHKLVRQFDLRCYSRIVAAHAAELGEMLPSVKKALVNNAEWDSFTRRLDEMRRAMNGLVRAEQRVSRLFDGATPGVARPETVAKAKLFQKVWKVLGLGSYRYAYQPWAAKGEHGAASDKDIEVVGERWMRDYRRQALAQLAAVEAKAAAEWDSMPDQFEELLEWAAAQPKQPRAKRGL